MKDELNKWEAFEAYEIVDDEGQDTIDGRWVVNKKEEHDGLKVGFKAIYCLRGFKENDKPRRGSPTVDRISTKIFYAIDSKKNIVHTTNISFTYEDLKKHITQKCRTSSSPAPS